MYIHSPLVLLYNRITLRVDTFLSVPVPVGEFAGEVGLGLQTVGVISPCNVSGTACAWTSPSVIAGAAGCGGGISSCGDWVSTGPLFIGDLGVPSVAVAPSSPSGKFGGADSVFHWRAHCCWHPAPPLPSDSFLFGPLLSLLELVLPCYLWTIWHWSCFEQKEHTLVYPLPLLQQEVFKTQEASHLGFPMPSPHHVHIIRPDQAVVPAAWLCHGLFMLVHHQQKPCMPSLCGSGGERKLFVLSTTCARIIEFMIVSKLCSYRELFLNYILKAYTVN